jgi:hypothetical protein
VTLSPELLAILNGSVTLAAQAPIAHHSAQSGAPHAPRKQEPSMRARVDALTWDDIESHEAPDLHAGDMLSIGLD